MTTYNPLEAPSPDSWLELDEQERIAMVRAYHRSAGVHLENETLHAAVHTVVENQLALRDETVCRTLGRLMAEGLDRHDALHAVGSVLAEHLWRIMKEGTEESAEPDRYYRALDALTVEAWRASESP